METIRTRGIKAPSRSDVLPTDLLISRDKGRNDNIYDDSGATKTDPSGFDSQARDLVSSLERFEPSTASKKFQPKLKKIQDNLDSSQAKDLVTLLENFQPRTALKPFLPQLKKIQDELDSPSRLETLAPPLSIQVHDSIAEKSVLDNKATDSRKWAYVFLLGGARSDNEYAEYLGGLYSIVAVAHQIRNLGSTADVVLMVQIAAESPHQKLTEFEEEILQKMNIKVIFIPKFANYSMECFYSRKYLFEGGSGSEIVTCFVFLTDDFNSLSFVAYE